MWPTPSPSMATCLVRADALRQPQPARQPHTQFTRLLPCTEDTLSASPRLMPLLCRHLLHHPFQSGRGLCALQCTTRAGARCSGGTLGRR